jgi:hypothetical protein
VSSTPVLPRRAMSGHEAAPPNIRSHDAAFVFAVCDVRRYRRLSDAEAGRSRNLVSALRGQ